MKHPLVLALTSDGNPHQWLHWQDAIVLKCKNLITFEMGNEDDFYGGTSRMTGERTHMQVGAIIGVKGKFKHSRATPVLSNTNLFKRDILTCGYCGKHFPESQLTRDHIVPVSKGGRDVWQNVVACCKKCNSHKGNKMLDDCGMNLLWVPYVPCRNETLILSNRNILFDQAQYIAGFLKKDSRAPRYLEEHLGIVLQ